jgi:hypothetical protein
MSTHSKSRPFQKQNVQHKRRQLAAQGEEYTSNPGLVKRQKWRMSAEQAKRLRLPVQSDNWSDE